MTDNFFEHPILNSPYEYPARHWELEPETRQPTNRIIDDRRIAQFITPIPKPRKTKAKGKQAALALGDSEGLSTAEQQYEETTFFINELRRQVDQWREFRNPNDWRVTPETARLLQHWRHHPFSGFRPFFCQVEAVETIIWLTEVAPKLGREGRRFLEHLDAANQEANPGLVAVVAEAGHRRRQDDRHGDDHRLADDQRRPAPQQQALHARLPRDHAWHHSQGPPARPAAQRPRRLLRQPRARAPRDARRPQAGAHRHHELPRLQAAGEAGDLQGRSGAAARARPGDRDAGDRGADDPARHAGADGHQEHPRDQRRSTPLLPREARRGRRREISRGTISTRPRRTARPPGSGSTAWKPWTAGWDCSASPTSPRPRSSCAAPATPRAASSPGR